MSRAWRAFLAAMLGASLTGSGCASKARDRELTQVARDWCMTIRASQVIPVYPPTEDLLPGDVLVTTTPVGNEQEFFRENGFLPFDNLVARLATAPPYQAAGGGGASPPTSALDAKIRDFYGKFFRRVDGTEFPAGAPFPGIPAVGFPTYSVEVSQSAGLSAAIPVEGIPLGLSFLGASRATAAVTLKDACSYGVDLASLNEVVDTWAKDEKIKALLAPYGTPVDTEGGDANYVRIVSRVFLVKKVSVTVLSGDSASGGAQFGGAEVPAAQILTDKSAAESATQAVDRINESLAKVKTAEINPPVPAPGAPLLKAMPSVSVRVVQATKRSISMEEEFARPVAIGYLAVDRQILPEGKLGPPLHTLVRLKGTPANPARGPERTFASDDQTKALNTWLHKDPAANRARLTEWMSGHQVSTRSITDFLYDPEYSQQRKLAAPDLIK